MTAFLFFNDTATTEIYTLSLHDALPIYEKASRILNDFLEKNNALKTFNSKQRIILIASSFDKQTLSAAARSEEHTSELQSRQYLVCRLVLEKKDKSVETRELSIKFGRRK